MAEEPLLLNKISTGPSADTGWIFCVRGLQTIMERSGVLGKSKEQEVGREHWANLFRVQGLASHRHGRLLSRLAFWHLAFANCYG